MILCIGCYCIWQTKTTAMMPQLHSQKHILTFNQLGPKKRPYRRFYAHNHPYTYLLLVTTGCQHVRNPMLFYSCQPEAMHPPLWAIQLNIGEVWSRTPSPCISRYLGTNSSILIVCDSLDFDILNAAKKVVADQVQIFALIAAACREPQQHRAPEETCSSKPVVLSWMVYELCHGPVAKSSKMVAVGLPIVVYRLVLNWDKLPAPKKKNEARLKKPFNQTNEVCF